MNEEIGVGDKFLVEVVVDRIYADRAVCIPTGAIGDDTNDIALSTLRIAKRLPRLLRVGDRVRYCRGRDVDTILAIDGGVAWVKGKNTRCRYTAYLSELTLAEESAS